MVYIGSVCVAFNVDENALLKALHSLLRQVDHVVVVNNGLKPLDSLKNISNERLCILENGDNFGVAEALNIGVRYLMSKECTHYLFLDQDSILPENMVATLTDTFQALQANNINIAAVGPSFYNPNFGEISPFGRYKGLGFEKIYGSDSEPWVPVHVLITSGTLVSAKAFQTIGWMEKGLFIDYVDTEWCLRALSKGYALYGDSRVVMNHALGGDAVVCFKKKIFGHSPLRHYYMARNLIHLMRRNYIPFNYRLTMFLGLAKVLTFYSIIPKDRFSQFKKIMLGFFHGFLGKYGRIDALTHY